MKKFKSVATFEKYMHGRTDIYGRNKEIPDYVSINGIIFTQDEYDIEGKQITYGNKRMQKTLFVENKNRYKLGFKDSKVYIEDFLFARIGFPYID